jgi:toxin ParE1/3/4
VNRPIALRPEAEADIESAQEWYNEHLAGLGDNFVEQVSETLEIIASAPERFAILWKQVRGFPLRRFPYVVYYRAHADRVEVLAVLHGRRDTSAWRDRA